MFNNEFVYLLCYDSLTTVFFVFNDFQKKTIISENVKFINKLINLMIDFNLTSQLKITIIKK